MRQKGEYKISQKAVRDSDGRNDRNDLAGMEKANEQSRKE
jgi:hypothetical protein